MIDVKLNRLNTLNVVANETYRLVLGSNGALDIRNNTQGDLVVSDRATLREAESIFIEAGGGYGNLFCGKSIYINPSAAGKVQVVVIRGL